MVVRDVNDNFPRFKEDSYFVNVMETDTTEEQIRDDTLVVSIGHISATDADDGTNATINYMITSGNPGKFTALTHLYKDMDSCVGCQKRFCIFADGTFVLNGDTGELKQIKPLDREATPLHHLVIQVTVLK